MADEADRANDLNDRMLQLQLTHREHVPEPNGACLYCSEPLAQPGARFCDVGCRDDWEFTERQRRVSGLG